MMKNTIRKFAGVFIASAFCFSLFIADVNAGGYDISIPVQEFYAVLPPDYIISEQSDTSVTLQNLNNQHDDIVINFNEVPLSWQGTEYLKYYLSFTQYIASMLSLAFIEGDEISNLDNMNILFDTEINEETEVINGHTFVVGSYMEETNSGVIAFSGSKIYVLVDHGNVLSVYSKNIDAVREILESMMWDPVPKDDYSSYTVDIEDFQFTVNEPFKKVGNIFNLGSESREFSVVDKPNVILIAGVSNRHFDSESFLQHESNVMKVVSQDEIYVTAINEVVTYSEIDIADRLVFRLYELENMDGEFLQFLIIMVNVPLDTRSEIFENFKKTLDSAFFASNVVIENPPLPDEETETENDDLNEQQEGQNSDLKILLAKKKSEVINRESSRFISHDQALINNLLGKILLQVQENGEAWYLDPITEGRLYLQNGEDAYLSMRSLGLGIKNLDLSKIPIGNRGGVNHLNYGHDTDGDGLSDATEVSVGTDPIKSDSDGDGYDDRTEVLNQYNALGPGRSQQDVALINRLKGRILLQVESKGEAWYVNPDDGKRYFLRDGNAAYSIMRELGLGITNENLNQIPLRKGLGISEY